mmetsp:Transcript_19699/g.32322  ORF Transcript_19699/g.32322 Transcript_19699/m.32322 type:complete len:290 (+) Transcript_19699:94-963(+)
MFRFQRYFDSRSRRYLSVPSQLFRHITAPAQIKRLLHHLVDIQTNTIHHSGIAFTTLGRKRIDDIIHVFQVQLVTLLLVKLTHLFHACLDGVLGNSETILLGILAHILCNLHTAELRSTHGAEVARFGCIRVKSFIVEGTGRHRVQSKVELIVPTELKAGLGQGIVTSLGSRELLGQVSSMSSNLVSNDSSLDIVTIGETQVLLGCNVAKHCSSQRSNVGSSNGRGDMIISWSNISCKGSKGVEGCLVTPIKLIAHVFRNLMERDVTGSLVHYLNILLPSTTSELALSH